MTRLQSLELRMAWLLFFASFGVNCYLYGGTYPRPAPTPAINPIGPVVPPAPPKPIEPPKPATVGNLRVLLLYESSAKLSSGQTEVFLSIEPRTYLSSHTIVDGGTSAWRYWDKDLAMDDATPGWQKAFATAKADSVSLPKVCFFAGDTLVKCEPLPDKVADMLALLKKYGG